MTLFESFDWLEQSVVGAAVRDSVWLFPAIEAVHLLGLALLGGSILVVDLRLLGFGLKDRSTAYVLNQASPWFFGATGLMFLSGIPIFLSEAVKCYFSPPFWVKLGALAVALVFTVAVRNPLVRSRPGLAPARARAIAACSLALWLTVAVAGRWVGFS